MTGTRASSLAKESEENWTEKHRNVARKIFLGRWMDAKETVRY